MSNSFGANVRARRLELGMTLQEVADKVGCTPQYVHKVEAQDAQRVPYTITMIDFCRALDTGITVISTRAVTSEGAVSSDCVEVTLDKPKRKRKLKK